MFLIGDYFEGNGVQWGEMKRKKEGNEMMECRRRGEEHLQHKLKVEQCLMVGTVEWGFSSLISAFTTKWNGNQN